MRTRLIAVSLGDPGGIGPEVLAGSLSDPALRSSAAWVVLGPARVTSRVLPGAIVLPGNSTTDGRCVPLRGEVCALDIGDDASTYSSGDDARNGELSFRAVQGAIDLALLPTEHPWHAHAVVTGPISKRAWALAGHGAYPGHTELFSERCALPGERAAMMFHAPARGPHQPGLNIILATVHQPLMTVAKSLSSERIESVIHQGEAMMRRLGYPSPRIGVCGLNPHAGEGGLLGEEDDAIVAPAINRAAARGALVTGPHPADTIFQRALGYPGTPAEKFDLVVALYHDQGLIPLKTLAWDRAVNFTAGLSIVRTSPDHGTAFDIAGKGIANPGSMAAAMRLALTLAS